jgi:hypothetical protein
VSEVRSVIASRATAPGRWGKGSPPRFGRSCSFWMAKHSRLRRECLSVAYVAMTSIGARMLDRELKKRSAELIILSIVEPCASRLRDQQTDRDALGRAAEGSMSPPSIRSCIGWKNAAGCRGNGWRSPASDDVASTV